MPRRVKTPEAKKEAIRAYLAINPEASEREISRAVDLPATTVHDQLHKGVLDRDTFERYRAEQKINAIQQGWEIAKLYMEHLKQPETISKAGARDSAIVIGTLIDKSQLLAGDPTTITDTPKPIAELLKETEELTQEMKKLIA
jgi:hypothetical protein